MNASKLEEAAIPQEQDPRSQWREALSTAAVGWEIVAAIAIGYAMGWGLDRWLGTGPWLSVVGTLFGLAAAVRALVRVVQEYRQVAGPDEEFDENAPPRPAWSRRRRRKGQPRRRPEGEPPSSEEG